MFCTLQLSKSDPTPVYIQLARELATLIKSGELPPGTKLPPIRTLSKHLFVNRDTVVSAYKLLENQGLTTAYVGNGTYVSLTIKQTPIYEARHLACSSLHLPTSLFSKEILHELLADIASLDGWDAFNDPHHREKIAIRQSIGEFFKSVGIDTSPAQVRLVSHFSEFLVDLLKCHSNHSICVESYHDLTYSSFLKSLGIKLIDLPLDAHGLHLDLLEETLKRQPISFIYVSSHTHNPTGMHYNLSTKKRLIELAHTYNCYIIEDGTYSDFDFTSETLEPLYTLDPYDQVIYVHHFSKLYLPALQYSFVLLPKHLTHRLNDTLSYTLNERVLHRYLTSSRFQTMRLNFIEQIHTFYLEIKALLHELSDSISFAEDTGGLFFWLRPLHYHIDETCAIFLKHNLVIAPGELFTFKNHSSYFRLSLASITPETLPHLIEALRELAQ